MSNRGTGGDSVWSLVWRWLLTSFAAAVIVPLAVLVLVVALNNHDISPEVIFRRGELFLISLGLLGAAVGTLPRATRHLRTADEVVVVLSMWTLVITAVCWGSVNALAIAGKTYAIWIPTWGGGVVLLASFVLSLSAVVISEAPSTPPPASPPTSQATP